MILTNLTADPNLAGVYFDNLAGVHLFDLVLPHSIIWVYLTITKKESATAI
jgi:hypothetical protein